jgi:phosphohistidine phosphatase
MKRLILLRHAKAVKGVPDYERPLADVGTADAHEAAAALKNRLPPSFEILCSPATRTRQTAEIVFPHRRIVFDERLYLASAATIVGVVGDAFGQNDGLVVVGHNDGLTLAALRLSERPFTDHIPTSGFCVLDFETVSDGAGRLVAFHLPQRIWGRF